MAAKRFRLKFMFWLDMTKEDELWLADAIEDLKQKRQFSQTIRDGIRLIRDLKAGRTEVLFSMFPWLAQDLAEPAPNTTDALLRHELDQLRELILTQGSMSGAPGTGFSGLKPLRPFSSAADLDDHDEVELTVRTSNDNASAKNFLSSIMSLQQ